MAEIGSLAVRLGLDNKEFKAGLKDAERQADNFGDNIKNLGAAIGIAFGVTELAKFTKDLYLLNETAGGVSKTFQSFGQSRQLMEDLRSATGGMVSELALMKTAVSAKNFKIPLEDLSKLLRFATIRAAETGQSVDHLAESIVLGISRKSIPILDNLGLSATEIQKEFARTGDFAKAVGNIIDQDLGNSALTIEDATKKSAQLAAEWENFKLFISDFTQKEGSDLLKFLSDSLIATRELIGMMKKLSPSMPDKGKVDTSGIEALGMIAKDAEKILADLNSDIAMALDPQNEIFQEQVGLIQQLQDEIKLYGEKLSAATNVSDIANYNTHIRDLKKELQNLQSLDPRWANLQPQAATGMGAGQLAISKTFGQADTSIIQAFNAELDNTRTITGDLVQSWNDLGEVFINTGAIIQQAGTGMFIALGEEIGNAMSGVNTFGDSILMAMSGFMKQFGTQLIEMGFAKMALDQLFALPGGGVVAIAAGTALVAAAQSLNASAQKSVSSIGGGGGGGMSSPVGANGLLYGDIGKQVKEIDLSGTFVIRGDDLIRIIEKQNYKKGFTG